VTDDDDSDDDDVIRHAAKLRTHRTLTATEAAGSLDIVLTGF